MNKMAGELEEHDNSDLMSDIYDTLCLEELNLMRLDRLERGGIENKSTVHRALDAFIRVIPHIPRIKINPFISLLLFLPRVQTILQDRECCELTKRLNERYCTVCGRVV